MIVYRSINGAVVQSGKQFYRLDAFDWDDLINEDNAAAMIMRRIQDLTAMALGPQESELLPPIGSQEVWAAGVTYFRSRDARMEESKQAGGGDFYARVYEAERPELFFKSAPYRVVGHRQKVRIRKDSKWNVPEPELTLVINSAGKIIGYTIGNDMSSRDIEGENPLYLPQAKVYDQSCALGPGILLRDEPLPVSTAIEITISRAGSQMFKGATSLEKMKRKPDELVEFLYREMSFPKGCYLMTGTGVVPPDNFTLQSGDEISITIAPIGTITNTVA